MGVAGNVALWALVFALLAGRATCREQELPAVLLRRLLYDEPNRMLQLLGMVSDREDALQRTFLSPAHHRAAALLQEWMRLAGLASWVDGAANVRGRAGAAEAGEPAVLVGSHYDTVEDAGKYDGALGIVLGISAAKAVLLQAALEGGLIGVPALEAAAAAAPGALLNVGSLLRGRQHHLLRVPVEVVAFSDEEGARFQSTYLGSRALTGSLEGSGLLESRDAAGVSLREALAAAGLAASPEAFREMALPPEKVGEYVEVHIEQGPVLQAAGRPLGVVTGIAGQSRLHAVVEGEQGHAGTVPMRGRRDPLPAAALVIAALERTCNGGPGGGGAAASAAFGNDSSLVCTVGSVTVRPNGGNVIPASVAFTLDIRSLHDPHRLSVIASIREFMAAVCAERGLGCRVEVKNEAPAVPCNPEVLQRLSAAACAAAPLMEKIEGATTAAGGEEPGGAGAHRTCSADLGVAGSCGMQAGGAPLECSSSSSSSSGSSGSSSGDSSSPDSSCGLPELASGAGHDAMAVAGFTKMGMLFVRCRDGISHSALEHAEEGDIATAAAALYAYLSARQRGGAPPSQSAL